jgi:predicted DNA-binding protein (UPF0251 family)
MLKEMWDKAHKGTAKDVVRHEIDDWFAEFEKNFEVLTRMIMDVDELAALRLAFPDEFQTASASEMIESGRKGGPLKMGRLRTAVVFASRNSLEWVELLGDKGTRVQKI